MRTNQLRGNMTQEREGMTAGWRPTWEWRGWPWQRQFICYTNRKGRVYDTGGCRIKELKNARPHSASGPLYLLLPLCPNIYMIWPLTSFSSLLKCQLLSEVAPFVFKIAPQHLQSSLPTLFFLVLPSTIQHILLLKHFIVYNKHLKIPLKNTRPSL